MNHSWHAGRGWPRAGIGAALVGLALGFGGAAASLFPSGLGTVDFAGGDLCGFRRDGLRGAQVEIVRQGTDFSGIPGSAEIPFPNGPGSYAVRLRSRGDGTPSSVAILTSLPFVPGASGLTFDVLSESARVRLELLFLDPEADVLDPDPADVQRRLVVPIERPGTGPTARFTTRRVPFPGGPSRPVRIQFRQQTLEPATGYFTLITNIRAGEPAAQRDRDGDGVADLLDDCPAVADAEQANSDGDRFGDACDNCVYVPNNEQADRDGDGVGDRCSIDIDGDGYTDATDIEIFAAAFGSARDVRCDFDDSGWVDLVDLAIFARAVRIGIASDDLWDFTFGFVDHSVNGGLGLGVTEGAILSGIPGSDLIAFPGRHALLVRSDEAGDPQAEGVVTSRPFVPRGPRLTLALLSESSEVEGTVRVLRPSRAPRAPAPEDILVEVPLRNDRPGTGPSARFVRQTIDIGQWFDAEQPLRSPRIQVQIRQHTLREGFGYFTLVGDVRTGP